MAFLWWGGTQRQICWCICPRRGEAPADRGTLGFRTWLWPSQSSVCSPWSQRTLMSCQASRSSICYFFVEREPQRVADPQPQDIHALPSSRYQQEQVFHISVSLQALLSVSLLRDMTAAKFVQMPETLVCRPQCNNWKHILNFHIPILLPLLSIFFSLS